MSMHSWVPLHGCKCGCSRPTRQLSLRPAGQRVRLPPPLAGPRPHKPPKTSHTQQGRKARSAVSRVLRLRRQVNKEINKQDVQETLEG